MGASDLETLLALAPPQSVSSILALLASLATLFAEGLAKGVLDKDLVGSIAGVYTSIVAVD